MPVYCVLYTAPYYKQSLQLKHFDSMLCNALYSPFTHVFTHSRCMLYSDVYKILNDVSECVCELCTCTLQPTRC